MKSIIYRTLLIILSITGLDANAQTVYSKYSVRCLGVELDGSQTLRVQGYGRNKNDAKEQAMKNAVYAVILDGIRDAVEGCNMRPLVTDVNARERYGDSFDLFFSDKSSYKEYVSMRDTKKRSADKAKDRIGYSYDLTVRVLRPELKAPLKADNTIK